MKPSLITPLDQLKGFMHGGAMNNQYGMQMFAITDPKKAAEVLPPPLKLANAQEPMLYGYIVNIREPSFAPWYMEGGIALQAEYEGVVGWYFIALMLSGPGSFMGVITGRESAGLPKKLCERIVVDRSGDEAHCFIERGGTRLLDVNMTMGDYNDPAFTLGQDACTPTEPFISNDICFLHRYRNGARGFCDMELVRYDTPTRFYKWEKARASITMNSTPDDPWGELPIVRVLGAGMMVSDNWVTDIKPLYKYDDTNVWTTMPYLFAGRYDRCTLTTDHQHYE